MDGTTVSAGDFTSVVLIRRFLRSDAGGGTVIVLTDSDGQPLGERCPSFVDEPDINDSAPVAATAPDIPSLEVGLEKAELREEYKEEDEDGDLGDCCGRGIGESFVVLWLMLLKAMLKDSKVESVGC